MQRAAHADELRLVSPAQALVGVLQRDQCAAHVAGQLQLLRGDGKRLLDLGQRPVVAVARQVLIQTLQRGLLALRFADLGFERTELHQRILDALLGFARGLRLLAQRFAFQLQALRDFF